MKIIQFIFLSLLMAMLWQCSKEDSTELENDSPAIMVKSTEIYRHDFLISGDEEGAVITQQAKHAVKSEFIRNESTNWSVVYLYQPEEYYVGLDSVEIEIFSGSDGTTNSGNKESVKLKFQIEN